MAERITIKKLRGVVDLLNTVTGHRIDYTFDGAYGGYRVVRNHESVDVSPRLSVPASYYWVHAYIDGVETGPMLSRYESKG